MADSADCKFELIITAHAVIIFVLLYLIYFFKLLKCLKIGISQEKLFLIVRKDGSTDLRTGGHLTKLTNH